jgi:hypothetical protein
LIEEGGVGLVAGEREYLDGGQLDGFFALA